MQATGCEQGIPDEVLRDNLTDDAASDIDDEEDNNPTDMISEEVCVLYFWCCILIWFANSFLLRWGRVR